MVETGAALAVMGNYELNAIAWHTPDLQHPASTCLAESAALSSIPNVEGQISPRTGCARRGGCGFMYA